MDTSPSITQYTKHMPKGFAINLTLFGCIRASVFVVVVVVVVVFFFFFHYSNTHFTIIKLEQWRIKLRRRYCFNVTSAKDTY